MKSKLTKLISLAMALTLVASFAACGKKGEEETTTGADASTEAVVTPDETSAEETVAGEETSAEETTAIVTDSEGHTKVVTQAPTKVVTSDPKKPTKPGNDTPGAKLPEGKDALIAAYNNGLGAMKSSVTRKVNSGTIDAGKLGTFDFAKKPEGQAVVNRTNDKTIATTAKKLNANDVASASVTGSPENYTITFNLKPVTKQIDKINKGDNGYMYFVDFAEANAMIPGIIKAAGFSGNADIIKDQSTITLNGGKYVVTVKNNQVTNATLTCKEVVKAKANFIMGIKPIANIDVNITATYTK